MRIALFGAAGQVGRALARVGTARGATIVEFDKAAADVTNPAAVDAAVSQARADVVVNAAAYTAVDDAERDPERAEATNHIGARNVATATEAHGVPMIYLSTDYVFDGAKAVPYVEDDPIAPLSVYGRTKAEGEAAVRAASSRAIIVRTSWIFGLEGHNFVKTMLRLAGERDVLRVVNDQRGCPTFADDLARGLLALAARPMPGTYHLAGGGSATWFEFATAIFATCGRGPRLEPITSAQYTARARRPAYSVLDCTRAKRTFGVELPPWNDGLSRMLHAHLGAR